MKTKQEKKDEAIQDVHIFMQKLYMNTEQVKQYEKIINLIKEI